MSSFEEIMAASGLATSDTGARINSGGCSYNPEESNHPSGDCGQIARWHVRLLSSEVEFGVTIAACDVHIGVVHVKYGSVLMDLHEWGSACNLEGAWWVEPGEGNSSTCMTVERGVDLGYLQYVETPHPIG